MTSDLIAFITARLDEDERIARDVEQRGPWRVAGNGHLLEENYGTFALDPHDLSVNGGEHIVRHDPARVLREVAAKRRLLALHRHVRYVNPLDAASNFEEDHRQAFDEPPLYVGCVSCHYDSRHEENYPSWWCDHVRLLAAPYSGHPDFDESWALPTS